MRGKPPGNPAALGRGSPVVSPATGTQCPFPPSRLPALALSCLRRSRPQPRGPLGVGVRSGTVEATPRRGVCPGRRAGECDRRPHNGRTLCSGDVWPMSGHCAALAPPARAAARTSVTLHLPPARPLAITHPGARACNSGQVVLPRRAPCRRESSLSRARVRRAERDGTSATLDSELPPARSAAVGKTRKRRAVSMSPLTASAWRDAKHTRWL